MHRNLCTDKTQNICIAPWWFINEIALFWSGKQTVDINEMIVCVFLYIGLLESDAPVLMMHSGYR